MSREAGMMKIPLGDSEALAAPNDLAAALELLQANVHSLIGETRQSAFHALAADEHLKISRLTADRSKESKVRAPRIAEDCALGHLQE
jgi:hypothetical protein